MNKNTIIGQRIFQISIYKRTFMKKYLFALSILVFTGCNSVPVYMNTQTAPNYQFDKNKTVAVLRENPVTIDNKKIVAKLFNILEKDKFKTKTDNTVDYAFSIQVEDDSTTKVVSDDTPVHDTKTEYKKVNGFIYADTKTTTSYRADVRTVITKYKVYTLKLYALLNNDKDLVWSGKAVLEDYYDYKRVENIIIDKLIKSIGKEYKGDIYITQEEIKKFNQ